MSAYTSPALKILEEKIKAIEANTRGYDNPDGKYTPNQSSQMISMIKAEINQTQTSEAQEWFKLAEGPGMDAASFSGLGESGIGYAPQRDITKTFPGAMSKEEEEYLLALRGPVPGMMTYKGIT